MKLFSRLALVAALTAGVCLRAGSPAPPAAYAQTDTLPGADTTAPQAPDTTSTPVDTASVVDTTAAPVDTAAAPVDTMAADTTAADTGFVDLGPLVPAVDTLRYRVDPVLSARVDTSDADVRDVVELWLRYLDDRADGRDGRQYWDPREVRRWDAFNLSAHWVFQYSGFFEVYRPTVLSVEPRSENRYTIRTLFYGEGLDPSIQRQNPWAITRQFAERDETTDQWWLQNPLGVITRDWMRSKVRHITFVYPPTHEFSLERAVHAATFCDSIVDVFPFFDITPFEFYITDSPEMLDIMIGIEYSLSGFPATRAMVNHGMLFTARGDEWNPHELAHMVVANQHNPDPVVARGFPGWVGGWDGASYRENMKGVSAWLWENPDVSFDDLVNGTGRYGYPGLEVVPGAVLCDLAYMMGGVVGVQKLFAGGAVNGGLYGVIDDVFGVDPENFQFMFRARVRELR